ncbi:MAG: filamentous hemagglutinin N-terminal domain-containing protein [Burkholderiales bacterium]|nr:filamentous hemagglutinin N-terminal domain-containing protein [Burkholderiales bacterium]
MIRPIRKNAAGHRACTAAPRAVALAVAACFSTNVALANPTNPTVVHGTAGFVQAGNILNVSNSHNAIINWGSFSIGVNELTRFIQPSALSAVLNRVTGQDPSAILGALQSNGRVFLINPNGIVFGAGAQIDVAGLVASTLNLSNEDFLGNRMRFTDGAGAGSVVNQGSITGGSVYLVGKAVANDGLITSPNGEVILAAGNSVELVNPGTPNLRVEIVAPDNEARNLGSITAEAGRIGIYAGLINQGGVLNASSAVVEGGRVLLKASQNTTLEAGSQTTASGTSGGEVKIQSADTTLVSGAIEAKGSAGTGGTVQVLGDKVGLLDAASINASGASGGGTVLVGGDYQGKNPEVQNAYRTYVGPDATIKADAIASGDGGKVVVWADDATRFYGNISARGGAAAGDGGSVEVSGKRWLDYNGLADTRAPNGNTGMLLLDPSNITINNNLVGTDGSFDGEPFYVSGASAQIQWSVIQDQLAFSNAIISTSSGAYGGEVGNITIAADSPDLASAFTLDLRANNDIIVNAGITNTGSGSLVMYAGYNDNFNTPGVLPGTGSVTFGGASPVQFGSGNITLNSGKDIIFNGQTVFTQGNIVASGSDIVLNGGSLSSGTGSITIGASGLLKLDATTGSASITNCCLGGYAITAGSGVILQSGTGLGQNALLGAIGGQSITAPYVEVRSQGSGTARIVNSGGGTQTIHTTGANLNGEGILVRADGGLAEILALANQNITVDNADYVRVMGMTADARIEATNGTQTFLMQGIGQNRIELGDPAAIGASRLYAFNQSVTAGTSGQAGGISLIGGLIDAKNAGIYTSVSGVSQFVSTSGTISATGGTSPGPSGADAGIRHDGSGQQTIDAYGIVLQGGATGVQSNGFIRSQVGGQQITVGAGGISVTGGGGNNAAHITQAGAASTQTITVNNGGSITLLGGTGTDAYARIQSDGTAQVIDVTAGGGIALTGGPSGSGNAARIRSAGDQSISVGSGGLSMTGGGGPLTGNVASLYQAGTTGTSQILTVNNGGAITLQGGSSAQTGVGTDGGSWAWIRADGDAQQINFTAGGIIDVTGGTVGSNNYAGIRGTHLQTISGSPTIVLTGGASGGMLDEGNFAHIRAVDGQTITAANIAITGGGGDSNNARIRQENATANQTITITGGGTVALLGGSAGANNYAEIRNDGAQQNINFAAGGSLNITGGSGTNNDHARVVANSGTQTITGSPTLILQGGSGGAIDDGNFAQIRAEAGAQNLTVGATAILSGASGGINNFATITAPLQDITVNGNLTLTGGNSDTPSGAVSGAGARIGGSGGSAPGPTALTLVVNGNVTMTGGSVVNSGAIIGSGFLGGQATDITMTVNGGNLTMTGGSGFPAWIGSPASNTAGGNISVTVPGGSIALGSGALINTSGDVDLLAGGSINISSGARITSLTPKLTANDMDIQGQVLASSGSIYIMPATPGRNIELGTSGPGGSVLALDNVELNNMTAWDGVNIPAPGTAGGGLVIGDSTGGSGALTITGDVNSSAFLNIYGTSIGQSGGVITGGISASAGSGNVSLTQPGNQITLAGGSTNGGSFSVSSAAALEIGDVSTNGGNVDIQTTGGSLSFWSLAGPINAGAGSVQLVSAGTISDGRTGVDIIAGSASLTGPGGVGTFADPIETQVASLAVSATGGSGEVGLINTGNLLLNSLEFSGTSAAIESSGVLSTGGAISTTGNLGLLGQTGLNVNDGINSGASGNLTLESGVGTDVVFGGAGGVNTSGGSIAITSGRDIVYAGSSQINSLSGNILLNAGNDVIFNSQGINSSGGDVQITAGRDYIHNSTSNHNNASGGISIQTGQDLVFNSGYINTSGGAVQLTAGRDFTYGATSKINTLSGNVGIQAAGDARFTSGGVNTSSGAILAQAGGGVSLSGGAQLVSSSGGIGLEALGAAGVLVEGATVSADLVSLIGENVTVGGSSAALPSEVYASSALSIASTGHLKILGGSSAGASALVSSSGTVTAMIGGDVILAGGSGADAWAKLSGNPDVLLPAIGGTVHLDAGSGAGSYAVIEAVAPTTIYVDFAGVTSGGYFVNGVEGAVFDPVTSTGFVADGSPAVLGTNLLISYGGIALPPATGSGVPPETVTELSMQTLIVATGESTKPPETEKDKDAFKEKEEEKKKEAPMCK